MECTHRHSNIFRRTVAAFANYVLCISLSFRNQISGIRFFGLLPAAPVVWRSAYRYGNGINLLFTTETFITGMAVVHAIPPMAALERTTGAAFISFASTSHPSHSFSSYAIVE